MEKSCVLLLSLQLFLFTVYTDGGTTSSHSIEHRMINIHKDP
jgi:hypothetical protein